MATDEYRKLALSKPPTERHHFFDETTEVAGIEGIAMHELVIRGATIIDGLGHDPLRADVAIAGGRIAAIGNVGNDAAKVVDADGLAPMPGIIDIHTHYDAQVTWDPTLSPSPSLGITTILTSNCGFGIVPSPPHLRNLAVVEGMDLDALCIGIDGVL